MVDYLQLIYEGVTEVSPDEVMGALMVGLALSLAGYGLCALGRKRAADPLPPLCGLIFAISAVSMAIGVGHSHYRSRKANGPTGWGTATKVGRPGGPEFAGRPVHGEFGGILLHRADADRDGRLTPDEAARFVREVDRARKGWVDAAEVNRAHRGPDQSPPISDFHPDTTRPGRPGAEKAS